MKPEQISVDPCSEVPIYVQIKNQIRLRVDRGELKHGEQLPTVRELALALNINANTVSRVYADLEREGYLSRRRGVGTFAIDPHQGEAHDIPGRTHLAETVRQLRALGYSSRQIIEMTAEVLGEVS
jgi:GntR family transcriptional regulator